MAAPHPEGWQVGSPHIVEVLGGDAHLPPPYAVDRSYFAMEWLEGSLVDYHDVGKEAMTPGRIIQVPTYFEGIG